MRLCTDRGSERTGAAVPDGHRGSLFLIRAGEAKGVEGRGRQDKGNASQHCLSCCLHVFLLGDREVGGEHVLLPHLRGRLRDVAAMNVGGAGGQTHG